MPKACRSTLGSAYSTAAERLKVAAAAAGSPLTCTTCAPVAATEPTTFAKPALPLTALRDLALAPSAYLTITLLSACATAGTANTATTQKVIETALFIWALPPVRNEYLPGPGFPCPSGRRVPVPRKAED